MLGWTTAAVLAVALAASWFWFLHKPAVAGLSQAQLQALSEQAAKSESQPRRSIDPYGTEAVKKAIREHAMEIQKPWLAYLAGKPARLAGSVTLDWTIASDGKPTQVTVAHTDFEQADFNEGVRAALAGIAFPPPPSGQPYHATHKLFFEQDPAAR